MELDETVAWTEKYRPKTTDRILGNEETITIFKAWTKQWTLKKKPTKACLLVGPPGVGKTTLARAAANDYGFRVVEMNASDVRTEKAIKSVLEPVTTSTTLDAFSTANRGNMILLDEVDGVFGREDRGGLGAILDAIKQTPLPVVLTANDIDDERFDDLRKACLVLRMYEIRPRLLVILINAILLAEGKTIDIDVVKRLVVESQGDIRSTVNDAQAVATSRILTLHSTRTRELDEVETIRRIFAGGGLATSRRALNETEIPLYDDELLLLIHDILPYVYTSHEKLAKAYDVLSRADIWYGKVGASRSRSMSPSPFNLPRRDHPPEWSLLPAALNELAAVGLYGVDQDICHALDVAPRISRKTVDRFQYRLWALDHLCGRVARVCHLSKRKALLQVIPTLMAIFRIDEGRGREMATQLDLEERDIDFLLSEAKTKPPLAGEQQEFDPTGFKLPFMGKDKFIQLMRAGISYDRSSGKFTVRRLDDLEAVEEGLTGILSRPVKFARQNVEVGSAELLAIQECYVDGIRIPCDRCEFLDVCPTHELRSLKFCLCDNTMADPKAYEEYVAKNWSLSETAKKPRRAAKSGKRPASGRKR